MINGAVGDSSALIAGGVAVFFNANGPATIRGVGVVVTGGGTVANFGTIEGGDYNGSPDGTIGAAVEFTSAGGELIVYGGSTFPGRGGRRWRHARPRHRIGAINGSVAADGAVVEPVGATSTTFSDFATLVLGSGSGFAVTTTLANNGSVAQSGILAVTGGVITNESGATWNIANGINAGGAAGTFSNAGLLTKTVGTGLVHVGVDFLNGILFGVAGTVDIALGALDFIGATNFFVGTVTGSGTLVLGGGSTSLDGVFTVASIEVQGASTSVTVDQALSYKGVWDQTGGTVSMLFSADKLTLTGSGDSVSGTINGAGTVDFGGGSDTLKTVTLSAAHMAISTATVTLVGQIDLTGVLDVTTPGLIIATGGAILTGGGTLVLSNSASNSVQGASATARLTNADRIQGAGQLGGGEMSLLNESSGSILGDDALALVINTGAQTVVNAGLIDSAGTGGAVITGAIDNTGTLVAAKGTLSVGGVVSGAGKVLIEGGTADLAGAFTENVAFSAAGGKLELARSQSYTGTITGFAKTAATSLDLLDIAFGASTKATHSGTTISGTLTVTDGTHTASIKLSGNYTTSTFTTPSDGHGGTKVVDPTAPGAAHAFIGAMAGPIRP